MKTYPMKARIRNEGSGPARVDIYDDIGAGGWFSEGYTPQSFADAIKGVSGPLDVHINSAGGDVSDGIAIASAIRAYPGRKRTVVDGLAASIASVIAQAGDERVVEPGAMLMVHDPFTAIMGNAAELRKTADTLDKHGDNLAQQYAERARTKTAAEWRDVMRSEAWFTADDAVAAGLADRVGTAAARLPQGVDIDQLAARAPARIMAALRSLPQAAAGSHPPFTGSHHHGHSAYGHGSGDDDGMHSHVHSHDNDADHGHGHDGPAPVEARFCGHCGSPLRNAGTAGDVPLGDGWFRRNGNVVFDPMQDGDDDSRPETDTDHDYWSEDGKQLKPIPPCPEPQAALTEERVRAILREEVRAAAAAALPVLAADKVDHSEWDAAKAWHNGTQADDPEAFYRAICAGEKKSGDPATQAHWALPYRYTPDSPPNAAAVRNCLARLSQTQDLKDPDAVKKKLRGLMKQVNPDYEPEDSTETNVFSRRLREMRSALPALKGAEA